MSDFDPPIDDPPCPPLFGPFATHEGIVLGERLNEMGEQLWQACGPDGFTDPNLYARLRIEFG